MVSVHQTVSESFRAFVQRVRSIEIRSIVNQLQHSPISMHWTTAQTRKTITQYFAFLYLVDHYPNLTLVPTREVDHVWHCHLLDTEKYASDCQILFGTFVHHFPFFGIHDEVDENQMPLRGSRQDQLAAAVLTQVLFRKHFGSRLGEFSAAADCEPLIAPSAQAELRIRPRVELDLSDLLHFLPEPL